MNTNKSLRWLLLLAALGVAIVLAVRAPEGSVPVQPTSSSSASAQAAGLGTDGESMAATRTRTAITAARRDPFFPEVAKPKPPPPPVVVVETPPPPSAPPLPFKFFGRMAGPDGSPSVYVTWGERLLAIKPGDTLSDAYRVEKVSDTEIVFMYLPLNQQQSVVITP